LTKLINPASVAFSPSNSALEKVLTGYDLLHRQWVPSLAQLFKKFHSQLSGKLSSPCSLSLAEATREGLTSLLETGIPSELSQLLRIEYHHLNACISAFSIQVVVERAQGATQPQTPNAPPHKVSVLPDDWKFIDETITASCEVLNCAMTLHLEGILRCTPVRTRICIISASILLLKAISLGGSEDDLKCKIGTLHPRIRALRLCGIDDLDFLSHYGELVGQHLQEFRDQFILLKDRGGLDQPAKQHDWKVRPFDPRIAPCPSDSRAIPLGISLDSLDFLIQTADL
jgi:hypothetical protein